MVESRSRGVLDRPVLVRNCALGRAMTRGGRLHPHNSLAFENANELTRRIEALRSAQETDGADLGASISDLEKKAERLQRQIFASLTPWQRALLSRHCHPRRTGATRGHKKRPWHAIGS